MDDMEEDELEELLERTCEVVSAIDEDGNGCVDLEELASFFETMNAVSGAEGDAPEEEAEAVIDGMGDGESIDLESLTDLLVETFAEDLDLLSEIEELLRVRQEEAEAQAADKLAQAWTKHRDDDDEGGGGDDDDDDDQEEGGGGGGGGGSDGDGSDGDGSDGDGSESDRDDEGDVDADDEAGSPQSAGSEPGADNDEDTLMALHGTAESVGTACNEEHEARDHELRSFFMTVRLVLKRRRRRLLREVQRRAAENKATVDEVLTACKQDVASGQELLEVLGDGDGEGDGEDDEVAELVGDFVGKAARVPAARCVQFAAAADAHESFLGLGKLDVSWQLCLDAVVKSSATGADSYGAVSLLVAAVEMVGKLPDGAEPLAAETVEQLCHVMALFPPEMVDKSQHPRLLPAFAKALGTIARQSTENATLVGTQDMLEVALLWLNDEIMDDEIAASIFDLLSVLCAMPTLSVLDLFLTESDGVNVCLGSLEPGRRVECMTAALSLIWVMATSVQEGEEETLEELVVEMVLEADCGVEQILAATSAVSDDQFHAAACRVIMLLAKEEALDDQGETPAKRTFAAEYTASVVNVVLTHVLPSATMVSVEPAGELLATLLDSPSSRKLTARTLESKGLSLLKSVLDDDAFVKVEIQRLYVAVLVKMAIMNDIKVAMMRAGLVDTVCATLRKNDGDVVCSINCADALCAISKQQDEVKSYIAKRLKSLNPLELLTQALRHFADNEDLAKSAATALWSIAYKNVKLKSSAGKCGAFILLCSAARMHRTKTDVLPHIFIALANLCANHGPNQLEAGRSEVMTICVEFLSEYMDSRSMVFAILNCLNSLISGDLEGQDANHAAFIDAGGKSVLEECMEHHESVEKINSLCATIQEALEDGEEGAQAALKKQQEAENLTALEAQELAASRPKSAWHRIDKHERTTAVRGPMELHVKHKKGRATTAQNVILYKHTIVFLENVKGKKKKQEVIDRYSLPLFSAVALDTEAPKVVTFSARTDAGVEMDVRMTCDGVADAKEWLAAIRELMPAKTGPVACTTASAFASFSGKGGAKAEKQKSPQKERRGTLKLEPRFVAWQGGVFFVFNLSKDKDKFYKLQRALPVADLSLEEAGAGRVTDGFVLEDAKDQGRGFYFTGEGGATIPAKMWIKEIQKQRELLAIEVRCNRPFSQLSCEKRRFAKPGSGQTYVKLKAMPVFSRPPRQQMQSGRVRVTP
jgi:hypothetical protein